MIGTDLQETVRDELILRGFTLVRFTEPPLGEAARRFQEWLARGFAGEMNYLSRRQSERLDPSRLLPELRSILVLGYPYDTGLENTEKAEEGNISRYAWGKDYHQVLAGKLDSFLTWFQGVFSGAHCFRSVDAQPVLEKAWAAKSGLGWIGKHSNVINAEQGSYFFISTILTDVLFAPDPSEVDRCGSCAQCMEICPTQAIVAPYVLDAGRCISYLTIELKGPIPRPLRPLLGNRVFGCDDCQEVCPWNRFSRRTGEPKFFPDPEVRNQPLAVLLRMDPKTFRGKFKESAISRPKWKGFMRNVLVAAGNSGEGSLVPLVAEKLQEKEPLVRGHAVWAYHRLVGEKASLELAKMQKREKDPFVLEELDVALARSSDL